MKNISAYLESSLFRAEPDGATHPTLSLCFILFWQDARPGHSISEVAVYLYGIANATAIWINPVVICNRLEEKLLSATLIKTSK